VSEFDFNNNYLSKIGCYDNSGLLLWELVKPRCYCKIVALDHHQAAVLCQSGRVADGNRVDKVPVSAMTILSRCYFYFFKLSKQQALVPGKGVSRTERCFKFGPRLEV
jgi:hypothetical protein